MHTLVIAYHLFLVSLFFIKPFIYFIKQQNHLKNARGPKEVVSRNLIDELTTASSKEGDDNLLAMV